MLRRFFSNKSQSQDAIGEAIIAFTVLMGVLLVLTQLIYNRSLCGDEVWLSLNIISKSHLGLLKPLDYVQIAPVLFLQVEKVCSQLIPNSEFGLKLFPLISYFLSFFFFYKIVRLLHKNYYPIIFSLALFAFNVFFIYYSNEVKQYMSDVLVLTSIYYFLFKTYIVPKYKYYILGVVGVIGIFLSNVAIIILFTSGLYLLYESYCNEKKYLLNIISISVAWVASFLLYFLLFIRNNPVRKKMVSEWLGAFMPANPFKFEFYNFLINKETELLRFFFQYGNRGQWLIILLILGLVDLVRKKRWDLIILTTTPIILHFVLSAFKLYPVVPRLCLYFSPLLIIICSFGFDFIINVIGGYFKMEKHLALAACIPVLMICYFAFLFHVKSFPIRRSEIRNSINYIASHMDKTDKVYVTYHASWCFEYYQKIAYAKMDPNHIIIENDYYMDDTLNYCRKVDSLNGRIWFLFTITGDEKKTTNFLNGCIRSKGNSVVQEFHTYGSDVYLYDFSNRAHL